MRIYQVYWFGLYYSIVGKEAFELVKANMKKLKKLYTRDSFALHRFLKEKGISTCATTVQPFRTLKKVK